MNKAVLMGRLGKDPELRTSQSGTSIATFNLATDESYYDNNGTKVQKTEWHRVVVFGKQAQACSTYLRKGQKCLVDGRIQYDQYTDDQGINRNITKIIANRVEFCGSKQDSYGGQNSYGQQDSYGQSDPYYDPYGTDAQGWGQAEPDAPSGGQETADQGSVPKYDASAVDSVPF